MRLPERKIIAAILEQPVIEKILTHPGLQARGTATLTRPRSSAASGLTIPIHHRSGGPQSRATGIGCARVLRAHFFRPCSVVLGVPSGREHGV